MQAVTVDQVAAWLREKGCPATSLELYREWKEVHHEVCSPLLAGAAAAAVTAHDGVNSVDAEAEDSDAAGRSIEQAVVDVLLEYGRQYGEAAIRNAAKRALSQLSPAEWPSEGCSHVPSSPSPPPPPLVAAAASCGDGGSGGRMLGTGAALLERGKEDEGNVVGGVPSQRAEEDLAKVTAVLAECLHTLVRVVDPMRKDVLIPLISLSATLSRKSAGRAAARFMLLTLYTRPRHENRVEVAKAWVQSLQHVSLSVLEHDIVPELYSLVNAKASERHILALNCVEYVAPLLGMDPTLRRSICQGLLRPLSEDESKTVRCHVVHCLVGLWPRVPECRDEREDMDEEWWCGSSFDECFSYYLELMVHLILYDESGTVRRRAIQGLRSEVFPKYVPHRMLLSRAAPLFLSFIERELAVPMLTDGAPVQGNAARITPKPSSSPSPSAIASGEKLSALEGITSRNCLVLVSLIHDVLHRKRIDDAAGCVGTMPSSVFNTYIHVLFPSVHALVVTCREHDALKSVICALASALASVVSALRMADWRRVRKLLELSLKGGFDGSSSSSSGSGHNHGAVMLSVCDGWRRRQLYFFFAFLTYVAGGHDCSGEDASEYSAIARDAAALLRDVVTPGADEAEESAKQAMTGADASTRLDACASCLAWFATRGDDAEAGGAAAVSSVLWSLTKSLEEKQRMLAVALVERASGLPMDDQVRSLHLWPPLLLLMDDVTYAVKEAALKAAVSMVAFVSTPSEQEKMLQAVLGTVEKAGCPSPLSVAFLRHWYSLMRVMPAEPRESFMYPRLATMIDQLAETLRKREGACAAASSSRDVQLPQSGGRDTEEALEATLAVLAAIPHCAVVTPHPLKKHLIPSMRLLASIPSLPAAFRSQLLVIEREYMTLLEQSRGGFHGASGFFGRMRDELKKHI